MSSVVHPGAIGCPLQAGRDRSLSRESAPRILWIVFVLIQAGDGVLTSIGIEALGIEVERNPLIVAYAGVVGPSAAVWGAKLLAVACGTVLHLTARYRTIAALVLVYLVCAIGPWMLLLLRI